MTLSSGDGHGPPSFAATLPPSPQSVRTARTMAEQCLCAVMDSEKLATVKLLVSELVTNAVVHAGTACHLQLNYSEEGLLRAEISDTGAGTPEARNGHGPVECGNGLQLVDALAARWGVTPAVPAGKRVWFELPL